MRIAGDERGSATVAGACAIAALAGLVVLVLYVGAAVSARHQAQSAADLAALAAASALVLGEADPCAQAGLIAGRMGVLLASCNPEGVDVVVSVRMAVDLGLFGRRDALATARAGPVE
ncbi:Rv3654c family TadE-like protein [Williamsia sp. 1135]|uniref:Rv3654c family TadE-like protein n=1 Tax=Williamsia sp. 1135 TaxID=1889262 RepID=UPI000A112496|nr:Rv3654c family TadE-like protein [Williamsia sp. 1135]ORM26843.1 pilus assembly protein TadE [Williamsia sp. 1135]